MCWLAVHHDAPAEVIAALSLRDVHPVGWSLGFKAIYGDRRRSDQCVFVAPPVRGWILVASIYLPEIGQSPDVFTPLMQELSRRFGSTQYFGTHRVVDYHAWAKAEDGILSRAYAYLGERGETLANLGEPTRQEVELGLVFKDDTIEDSPDEEDVLRMAGAWSVNPNELDAIPGAPDHGWVGIAPERWSVASAEDE
jgi:hypothetical protein